MHHILPLALPAQLSAAIETEAVMMKQKIDAGISASVRDALSVTEVRCWGNLQFDAKGGFRGLSLALDRTSRASFGISLDCETFSRAQQNAKEVVMNEFLAHAAKRRMAWGRELAHLSDVELESLKARTRGTRYWTLSSSPALQEAFLGYVVDAEITEREKTASKHMLLEAIKKATPLRDLLADELQAVQDHDCGFGISKVGFYGVSDDLPQEARLVYSYRAYHSERREGFPLFNIWGEPWPKKRRRNKAKESHDMATVTQALAGDAGEQKRPAESITKPHISVVKRGICDSGTKARGA